MVIVIIFKDFGIIIEVNKVLKIPAVLGNGFIINEFLFSYFILLFKLVISGRDITEFTRYAKPKLGTY